MFATGVVSRWQNLPPNLRKATRHLALAIVISTVLTAAGYYVTAAIYGIPLRSLRVSPGKIFPFLDAVLAGIAAFTLLGAFAFLASTRRPEEEALDDRIAFLFSARRPESPKANEYLKKQIMLLGASGRKMVQTVQFVELSPDRQFVKTTNSIHITIVNMMKHDRYEQKMPLKIGLDGLPGLTCDLGLVRYVRITRADGPNRFEAPHEHLPYPHRLTLDNPQYDTHLELQIPPDGEIVLEYLFDGWSKANDVDVCGSNRFIGEFEVVFTNSLDNNAISIDPEEVGSVKLRTLPASINLQPGAQERTSFGALPPDQDVTYRYRVLDLNQDDGGAQHVHG